MWATAAFLVVVSTPPEGTAGFELQWDAPLSCPGGDDVHAAIGELLAGTDALATTRVHAAVRIESRAEGFAMHVMVGDGARELVAGSCEDLAATVAFLVAIAIDPRVLGRAAPISVLRRAAPSGDAPRAVGSPQPTSQSLVPLPDAPSRDAATHDAASRDTASRSTAASRDAAASRDTAAPTATDHRVPPTSRPRSIAITGRVAGGIGLGPSPRTTAAFVASGGVTGRWFRAELEGQYWIPRRVSSQNNGDVGLVAQLWTVGARGCGVLARGRLEIPLCAVGQAGLIHARGRGDLMSRRARVPWVAVGGGVMAIGWLGRRIGIGGGVDVLGTVVAGGFRSVPSGDVDRVGPLALTATAGVFWRSAPIRRRRVPETPRAGQPGG